MELLVRNKTNFTVERRVRQALLQPGLKIIIFLGDKQELTIMGSFGALYRKHK